MRINFVLVMLLLLPGVLAEAQYNNPDETSSGRGGNIYYQNITNINQYYNQTANLTNVCYLNNSQTFTGVNNFNGYSNIKYGNLTGNILANGRYIVDGVFLTEDHNTGGYISAFRDYLSFSGDNGIIYGNALTFTINNATQKMEVSGTYLMEFENNVNFTGNVYFSNSSTVVGGREGWGGIESYGYRSNPSGGRIIELIGYDEDGTGAQYAAGWNVNYLGSGSYPYEHDFDVCDGGNNCIKAAYFNEGGIYTDYGVTADTFTGDGSGLTGVTATIDNTNYCYLNNSQTFTANQKISTTTTDEYLLEVSGTSSGYPVNDKYPRFLTGVDENYNPYFELHTGSGAYGYASYIDFATEDSADFNARLIRLDASNGNMFSIYDDNTIYLNNLGSSYLKLNLSEVMIGGTLCLNADCITEFEDNGNATFNQSLTDSLYPSLSGSNIWTNKNNFTTNITVKKLLVDEILANNRILGYGLSGYIRVNSTFIFPRSFFGTIYQNSESTNVSMGISANAINVIVKNNNSYDLAQYSGDNKLYYSDIDWDFQGITTMWNNTVYTDTYIGGTIYGNISGNNISGMHYGNGSQLIGACTGTKTLWNWTQCELRGGQTTSCFTNIPAGYTFKATSEGFHNGTTTFAYIRMYINGTTRRWSAAERAAATNPTPYSISYYNATFPESQVNITVTAQNKSMALPTGGAYNGQLNENFITIEVYKPC